MLNVNFTRMVGEKKQQKQKRGAVLTASQAENIFQRNNQAFLLSGIAVLLWETIWSAVHAAPTLLFLNSADRKILAQQQWSRMKGHLATGKLLVVVLQAWMLWWFQSLDWVMHRQKKKNIFPTTLGAEQYKEKTKTFIATISEWFCLVSVWSFLFFCWGRSHHKVVISQLSNLQFRIMPIRKCDTIIPTTLFRQKRTRISIKYPCRIHFLP